MRIIEMVEQLDNGKTVKQLEKELRQLDLAKSNEPGKYFGKCDSCESKTVLMKETDMCGPCSTGEAATANGNW
jgi:hypothetical protein